MNDYDNPLNRSMEDQIKEAKRKAELYAQSLLHAREHEANAMRTLEQERQKWNQSFEQKSVMINQLERELQAAVDTIDSQRKTTLAPTKNDYPILSDEAINSSFKNLLSGNKPKVNEKIDETVWNELLNQYKGQLSKTRQELKEVSQDKQQLTDRILELSHDLAAALGAKDQFECANRELEGKLKFRTQQVRDYEDDRIKSEGLYQNYQQQLEENENTIRNLQAQLTIYETDINTLKTKIADTEHQVEVNKEQEQEKYKQFQDSLDDKEKQISKLEVRIRETEEKYGQELTTTKQMIYSLQLRIRKGDSPRNSMNQQGAGEMAMMNGMPMMMMHPSTAMYDGSTGTTMIAPDGSLMISHIPNQPDQSHMMMDPNNTSYAPDPFLHHPMNVNNNQNNNNLAAESLKNLITSSLTSLPSNGEKSPAASSKKSTGSKSPTRNSKNTTGSGSSTPRATSPKKSKPTAAEAGTNNGLKKTGSNNNLHVTVSFDGTNQTSKPAIPPQQPAAMMGYGGPPTPSNGMKYAPQGIPSNMYMYPSNATPGAVMTPTHHAMRSIQQQQQHQQHHFIPTVASPHPTTGNTVLSSYGMPTHPSNRLSIDTSGLYSSSGGGPQPVNSLLTPATMNTMHMHNAPPTASTTATATTPRNNTHAMTPTNTPSSKKVSLATAGGAAAAREEYEDGSSVHSHISLDSHHSHGGGGGHTQKHTGSTTKKSKKVKATASSSASKVPTKKTGGAAASSSNLLKPTASSGGRASVAVPTATAHKGSKKDVSVGKKKRPTSAPPR